MPDFQLSFDAFVIFPLSRSTPTSVFYVMSFIALLSSQPGVLESIYCVHTVYIFGIYDIKERNTCGKEEMF